MDDDVTSSLNTLLDTRQEVGSGSSTDYVQTADGRIVWTYNAPVSTRHEVVSKPKTLFNPVIVRTV